MAIVHHASGVHIYKVSVLIIQIYVIIFDFIVSRSIFRAIIHVFNTCKLELLTVLRAIGICQIISDIERAAELHVVLGQMLALGSDAVHVVVAHGEGVGRGLAVCSGVCTRSGSEAVQPVVCIGVRHLAAGVAVRRK